MALNPNTIKALFGKLAPYADDVAKGVVNYGDDVARAVVPYADDAAKAVVNYGDDALQIVDEVDDLTPNMRLIRDNYQNLTDDGKKFSI